MLYRAIEVSNHFHVQQYVHVVELSWADRAELSWAKLHRENAFEKLHRNSFIAEPAASTSDSGVHQGSTLLYYNIRISWQIVNRGDTSILAASFAEAAARELYIILKKIHFKEFEKVIRWINNQDFAAAVAAVLLLLSSALSEVLKYATKYSVPDFSAMLVERCMFIRFMWRIPFDGYFVGIRHRSILRFHLFCMALQMFREMKSSSRRVLSPPSSRICSSRVLIRR